MEGVERIVDAESGIGTGWMQYWGTIVGTERVTDAGDFGSSVFETVLTAALTLSECRNPFLGPVHFLVECFVFHLLQW